MRNRNIIELLGFWESIYNPNSKPVEFDGFRKQAGLNLIWKITLSFDHQKTFFGDSSK